MVVGRAGRGPEGGEVGSQIPAVYLLLQCPFSVENLQHLPTPILRCRRTPARHRLSRGLDQPAEGARDLPGPAEKHADPGPVPCPAHDAQEKALVSHLPARCFENPPRGTCLKS